MPEYDFFTPTAGLEQIHQAALRILDEIGVEMDHVEMRERLAGLGCRVAGGAFTFPPGLIAATLAAIPPSFQALWAHPGDHRAGGRRRPDAVHQHRHPAERL